MSYRKYKNERYRGYASKKEAQRAADLKLLQQIGKIQDLREQVRFELIPKQEGERAVYYVADFVFMEDGVLHVEDVKSSYTSSLPVWVIKRKLMLWRHGIRVEAVD